LLTAFCPYLLLVAEREFVVDLRGRLCPADLVQETLLEAFLDFAHFHGRSVKELLAWLRRILLHNLLNERRRHVRTAKRRLDHEVPLAESACRALTNPAHRPAESPSVHLQAEEKRDEVERALQRLPERQRHVLLLHTLEGLTFAEVGARLHCSAEAARKLWGRAADRLAELLRED
jgi:RNA polymerase sigma-70 factor (ECF subfamily)